MTRITFFSELYVDVTITGGGERELSPFSLSADIINKSFDMIVVEVGKVGSVSQILESRHGTKEMEAQKLSALLD